MQVIPVLDLRHGDVVHAHLGQREFYQPVTSCLCDSHEPLAICRALLSMDEFPAIYIADLDSITGTGDNREQIHRILAAFPDLQVWLDAGQATVGMSAGMTSNRLLPVIGSESVTSSGALIKTLKRLGRSACILSLDFAGERLLGPPDLAQTLRYWPERLIVMCLDRIGADRGPDKRRLDVIGRLAPGHALYAAGGIRDRSDLETLSAAGIAGALIASALHDGRLERADIRAITNYGA